MRAFLRRLEATHLNGLAVALGVAATHLAIGALFLLLPNHFAIRKYNNSIAYALGVGMLADRVARPFLWGVLLAAAGAAVWWWPSDPARAVMAAVAVLVVTSGDKRVDEKRVAAHTGGLGRADADFVKSRTGFSIGGVSPLAHATPCVTLIDRELFRFEQVWAAAGHPHGVFQLQPQDLVALTGAPVADVVEAPEEENVLDTLARENAIKMLAARAISVCARGQFIMEMLPAICRRCSAQCQPDRGQLRRDPRQFHQLRPAN